MSEEKKKDRLGEIEKSSRSVAEAVNAIMNGNIAFLTEREIVDYLLINNLDVAFTKKFDGRVIEVGFPFKTHEENQAKGILTYYTSGSETSYNNPAMMVSLIAIKEYVENLKKSL